MNKKSLVLALASIYFPAAAGWADSVVISQVLGPSNMEGFRTRGVTTAESTLVNQPAPVNGDVYQYKVTTDGDILSVNNILITFLSSPGGPLYNNAFGDSENANKPVPGLEPVFLSITADSWIDTPGMGFRLGPDLPGDRAPAC